MSKENKMLEELKRIRELLGPRARLLARLVIVTIWRLGAFIVTTPLVRLFSFCLFIEGVKQF